MPLDEIIENEDQLERILSWPSEQTREILSHLDGEIMVLGAAGKMGPTLCRLIKNAAPDKTIYAVSRFSEPAVKDRIEQAGMATLDLDRLEISDDVLHILPAETAKAYQCVPLKYDEPTNTLTIALKSADNFRAMDVVTSVRWRRGRGYGDIYANNPGLRRLPESGPVDVSKVSNYSHP